MQTKLDLLFYFFKCLFIFDRERETERERQRDRTWVGEGKREREKERERERERERESKADSRLQDVCTEPDVGLKLTNNETMTWVEVGCLTDWAIQVPHHPLIFNLQVSLGLKWILGHLSKVGEIKPHIGLCTDRVEPAWDSLSPSSSAPPSPILFLSK